MKEFRIPVRKSARYYTLGEPGDHIRAVWIVLHGYGQLAGDFLPAFRSLDNGKNLVVAPEGLSRFYTEGFDGKVGASWMTREDRLAEIQDQINYLDALYRIVTHTLPLEVVVNIVGFSQGAAAAARWCAATSQKVHNLICWAGILPEDIPDQRRLPEINGYFVYGTRDPFLNKDRIAKAEQILKNSAMEFKVMTFDGKHHINSDTLSQLDNILTPVRS